MVRANFLNNFLGKKLDKRRFRPFHYVLILFLIVTVNNFFKMTNQSLFSEVTMSCFWDYNARMPGF